MNRLSRDEIIGRGLDQVDSPTLNQRERPGGVLKQDAMAITWLQEAIDYFHNRFPWAGLVKTAAVSLTANGTGLYALPTDFVLDVRDGLIIANTPSDGAVWRIRRRSLQWYLNGNHSGVSGTLGQPRGYVIQPPNVRVFQIPDKTYTAELWYYSLPALLRATDVPVFPDDWTLVKYVTLAGKEWTGEAQQGAAMQMALSVVSGLRQSGLAHEPESDQLPLDNVNFRPVGPDSGYGTDWMGQTTVNP